MSLSPHEAIHNLRFHLRRRAGHHRDLSFMDHRRGGSSLHYRTYGAALFRSATYTISEKLLFAFNMLLGLFRFFRSC